MHVSTKTPPDLEFYLLLLAMGRFRVSIRILIPLACGLWRTDNKKKSLLTYSSVNLL